MRKIIDRLSVVAVVGILCGLIIVVSMYYHGVFERASAKWADKADHLQSSINSLEQHIGDLERRPKLAVVHYSGELSTTDRPTNSWSPVSETGPFRCVFGKGTSITPSLLVPYGSTNVHEFEIQCDKVADVWLSHSHPYSDLACFEQFSVYKDRSNNGAFKIRVKLKPGSSVQMSFSLVAVEEH